MSEILEASMPEPMEGKKKPTKYMVGKQAQRDANLILNSADRVIARCIREKRPWGVEELQAINMALMASLRHLASDKGKVRADRRVESKVNLMLRILDQAHRFHQGRMAEKLREEKQREVDRMRQLNDELEQQLEKSR